MRISQAVITAAGKDQRSRPLQHLVDRDGAPKPAAQIIIAEAVSAGTEQIELVVHPATEEAFRAAIDKVAAAIRALSARMPIYITLKDVKKRWGHGQEDIFPVTQFEKRWVDLTGLPELACRFIAVPRLRGQQLKDSAQLDGWPRDGSAVHVESLCDWT